jgi:hypothetical protein
MTRVLHITMLVLACSMSASAASAQTSSTHKLDRDGLKLELGPLASDQVRAFFLGRRFPTKDVEHIVTTGCVFRSAIGSAHLNPGDPDVTVTLTQWRITPAGGGTMAPRTREEWEVDWKARFVEEDAATAFYWSFFPTEQTFAPTDYNWGFLSFGLAPGARFSLDLNWRSSGLPYTARMEGLECGK